MADRAVIGHILEFFPMLDRDAAPGLLFVQEGFDQQRSGKDLVARRVQQVRARHVGGAHRFAFAAAQAILDAVGDCADIALLHDQRFMPHQPERRRVSIAQVGAQTRQILQLALVEAAFRIDAFLVGAEVADLGFGQEFQLGDADAMFARDHAVERARQQHDAGNRRMRILQHFVMIRIDRYVGVHVAVAGMHVQRHENAPTQDLLVNRGALFQHQAERAAGEDLAQHGAHVGFPGHPQRAVLGQVEHGRIRLLLQTRVEGRFELVETKRHQVVPGITEWPIHVREDVRPARTDLLQQRFGLVDAVFQDFGVGDIVAFGIFTLADRQIALCKKHLQFIDQLQLVLDRQFDVDALDTVGVLAHAVQRNDDVFIDLEGVGVLGNGGGTGAIEPEFLACFRADGNETFADPGIGDADHFRGRLGNSNLIIPDNVAEQCHLRQYAALGLGGITDCAQIALVEVFQAGQDGAALQCLGIQVILDLDDRWNRIARLAKEFQADGAGELRHLVQDPAGRRDQAVAAFFLDAGQTGQEFVGDVLAESFLAERAADDVELLGLEDLADLAALFGGMAPVEAELRHRRIVNLAQVVFQARDFEPVAVRVDHSPAGQVVERGTPQDRLLAAGIHGDVAADAGGFGRGRIDREHETGFFGRVGNPLGDHAGARIDRRVIAVDTGQAGHFDRAQGFQLFCIDDGRQWRQRNRAAGVTGTTAARNDGQAEFDATLDQAGHLILGIRRQDHERILDAPIGGVGHVRDARQAVELDVVLFRVAA